MNYARCNWMLSLAIDENGQPCRYMAKADTVQAVVDDMSHHLQNVHKLDPAELLNNIKAITKETGTKPNASIPRAVICGRPTSGLRRDGSAQQHP